ncbi:MetQ/NlpA family ABC transporter substrate-binding protein [Paenibacillus larvae]|uniref:Lipoprotein n=3 Tax=Paenibacillus larvae TaxID=1464 RepID=V9W5I4_9BACL|nr:MetQ/NlpA family ABC transporter substrate-binding protein [Paenibacillus larvae]AHD05423.1 putative D-methionine-binding lipoprotein MetQ [Paenibacillus larvae subsp. larvae DSM 25430]AQR77081.1 methionine ABC transporter substrate-binding protein [Paenibacillus larvae subsp. larvae]AQT86548.1 methionine ABC transporter substrate-binding protein [Paenibacillus larvae subsp. pulvifaciens]AQZ48214.1 methionine ABC transporter substrate-binding protein [Paenibacillus larvae subsp. pulvifaciens
MKKAILLALTFILAIGLSACGKKDEANNSQEGSSSSTTKLVVGATSNPHAEILNAVKDKLKAEGVELDVKEFNDYVQPNVQLDEKQLDANFYQHTPYLDDFNKQKGTKLVKVVPVHIEPFGAYSKKIKNISELKDGANVAIPNDATNLGRALALLEKNGLIKLKDGVGISGTVKDITENKKNLNFKEMEAAMLPRVVDEVDLALINTNYALQAKLDPGKDALLIEDKDSPYANILVAREDNKDSEAIKKLANALNSEDAKKFIEDKYKGQILPAF